MAASLQVSAATGLGRLIAAQQSRNRLLTVVLALTVASYAGFLAVLAMLATESTVALPLTLCVIAAAIALTWTWLATRLPDIVGARQPTAAERVRLEPLVAGLAEQLDVPAPQVLVCDDTALNAFATGVDDAAVVAFTTGLLRTLNDDELRGVAAHELAHIANRDTRLAMIAIATLFWCRLLSSVCDGVARMLYGSRHLVPDLEPGRRPREEDPATVIRTVLILMATMLRLAGWAVGTVTELLWLGLGRQREWLADEVAATLTGRPEHVVSALARLEVAETELARGGRTLHDVTLVGLPPVGRWADLFKTHPSTPRRIARLQRLTDGRSRPAGGLLLTALAGLAAVALLGGATALALSPDAVDRNGTAAANTLRVSDPPTDTVSEPASELWSAAPAEPAPTPAEAAPAPVESASTDTDATAPAATDSSSATATDTAPTPADHPTPADATPSIAELPDGTPSPADVPRPGTPTPPDGTPAPSEPAPALTPTRLAVRTVWTRDADGRDSTTFRCGQGIHYAVYIDNPTGQSVDVLVRFRADGDQQTFNEEHRTTLTADPIIGFYRPATLPADSRGRYTIAIELVTAETTASKSATYDVLCPE